jgi:hypothetical protein
METLHFLIKVRLGHFTWTRCGSILLKNVHVVFPGVQISTVWEKSVVKEFHVIDGVHFSFFGVDKVNPCLSLPTLSVAGKGHGNIFF